MFLEPNNKSVKLSGSTLKTVWFDESDKSVMFKGIEELEWTLSLTLPLTLTQSVKTLIVFSFKFSLTKEDIETSSVKTLIFF